MDKNEADESHRKLKHDSSAFFVLIGFSSTVNSIIPLYHQFLNNSLQHRQSHIWQI